MAMLRPGDRLPSVRELARTAGVNVNTVRSVYARLEAEGAVQSEHGRGTFVATPAAAVPASRAELRSQIARLEAALVRLPPPPAEAQAPSRSPRGAALQSTADLEAIRDELVARLEELDARRAVVVEQLEQLGVEPAPAASRSHTPSLTGARIRWVGA